MKVKLYRKFIRRACKLLRISREQLFAREFGESLLIQYKFNCKTKKLDRDASHLEVLQHRCPLSQLWRACDGHTAWLFKHWRHSHWKPYVQTKIDLGFKEDEVLASICQKQDL